MFMFPMEGDNPTRHDHYVLWAIILVCVAAFIATLAIGRSEFLSEWGYTPSNGGFLNIFTSMFLHGGYWHILGNMVFLWMFGDNIEDVIGHVFFLLSFLLCGLVATLGYSAFHADSVVPLVGASGAISGIVGMYLVFFPKVSAEIIIFMFYWEIHRIKTTIYVAIGCWFLIQILFGIAIEATHLGDYIRVAFSAHAAGFIAGVLIGLMFTHLGYVERYVHNGRKHWLFGYAT